MSQQLNEFTGAPNIWDEPAAAEPSAEQKLVDHIHQTYRGRHPLAASHPALMEVARRLGEEGKLDLTHGQGGIDSFCDEVARELEKPENNGRTGMAAEIDDWQKANGFH